MARSDYGKKYGFGQYGVTVVKHFLIPMRDGIQLAAKAWFPSTKDDTKAWFPSARLETFYEPDNAKNDEKYPIILEYLPYRKSDFTAMRDHRRLSWFASQGYVALRVDIRGSGESEGLYYDEYLPLEQQDCIDIMKWTSAQAWSTGKVGMYGKSWGGFNGLQMAFYQPEELKAVVSAYSTDDRYATDIHHDGGCIMDGLLSWASAMFVLNARCPDPRLASNWKEMWKNRLEHTNPWSQQWLKRQLRDEFWAHGSVCEDYNKVQCPVLLIGGWRDGYRDAVFRMLNKLPKCKAIIGPWPHDWPDTCKPGPNIEYLQVAQQWFDHHLKGLQTNALDEPKLRLFLQSPIKPGPTSLQPGRWIQFDGWPSSEIEFQSFKGQGASLKPSTSECTGWDKVPFSMIPGMNQGLWLQFMENEGPPDQRLSDAYSLVYTSDEIVKDMSFVGLAELACRVKVTNHNQGILAARLVDQFPTGECTLVTSGVLNLTHFQGDTADKVRYLKPGEEIQVSFNLHATSYVFPKGHRFKLCLSSCFWPFCWPSSKCVDMYVSNTTLQMPLNKQPKEYKNDWFDNIDDPKVGPPMETTVLNNNEGTVKLEMDFPNKKYKKTVTLGMTMPELTLCPLDVTIGNRTVEISEVEEDRPNSAKLLMVHHYVQNYPKMEEGMMATGVETESSMEADETHFFLKNKLKTTLNGEVFFEKEWEDKIERLFV